MEINYQSDFKLHESGLESDLTTPFRFTYRTDVASCYVAQFDGSKYTNCRRQVDGTLLVIFDNHGLGKGRLSVKREWFLSDEDFSNDICKLITNQQLEVVLCSGKTEEIVVSIDVDVPDGLTSSQHTFELDNITITEFTADYSTLTF